MGIITISRGSYSNGKFIAENLAEALGYTCISRDILLETSEHFNIPELKLARAIHDAPSFLNRVQHGREKFIAYIKETLLEHVMQDNVVYHGLAGHFLLKGIPNILKVRITADLDYRVEQEMKRKSISAKKARLLLVKDDEERRKWGMRLYGADTNDSALYDVVFHIDNLRKQEVVEILTDIAKRETFQTTEETKKVLAKHYLAAKVHSAIIDDFPTSKVYTHNDSIVVSIETSMALEEKTREKIYSLTRNVTEHRNIKISILPIDVD